MRAMRPHLAVLALLALLGVSVPRAFAQIVAANDASDATLAESASSSSASAAVTREELEAVAVELARLRAEVASLRADLAAIRTPALTPVRTVYDTAGAALAPVAQGAAAQPQVAPEVEMLRTQVDELSQTKVESTSRM